MSYSTRRPGLTLLELVVVLVILVALAGILVPMLPGMLGRAHTAEHGTNVTEINKAVESYNIIRHAYPDNLDTLTLSSILPGYNSEATPASACGGDLIQDPDTLTTDGLAALTSAGINTVWTPTGTDLVANPYGTATSGTTLTETSKMAILSAAAKFRLYNEPMTSMAKYVVFGLGPRCDMIGRPGGMPEAPLHFSDESGTAGDPSRTYSRYALVFRISRSTGEILDKAQFAGALALHADALSGAGAAIAEYHAQNPQ